MGLLDIFRPPWKQSEWSVRAQAVKALTDEGLLSEIATTDSDPRVRIAAVASLSDQQVLARIARSDADQGVRQSAVAKTTDPLLLAKVAVADRSPEVRAVAASKLGDQPALASVATRDVDPYVRAAAARNLKDPRKLDDIARTDKHEVVRQAASEARQIALGATSPLEKAVVESVVRRPDRRIEKASVLILCKDLHTDSKSFAQGVCDRAFGGRRIVVARHRLASVSHPTVAKALELSTSLGMGGGEPEKTWEGVGPNGERVAALFWDAGG